MLSRCPTRASLKIIDFCSEKVSVNQAAKLEMVRMERESLPRHYTDLVSHKILQSLTALCLICLKHTQHRLAILTKSCQVVNIPVNNLQQTFVHDVTIHNNTVLIILLYKPPVTPQSTFLLQLKNLLDQLPVFEKKTIVIGDLNIDDSQSQ
ncbi:hypothetical protein KUTeg_011876, partial [Tegillarca granosa]